MNKLSVYEKYCKNEEHAKEVAKYALMILSALKDAVEAYKNITERETLYLQIAALLHDIGYVVEKKSHHKHAMNLIIQEGLEGLDNEETKVTANIARYHRGSLPDETKHEIYKNLTPQQKNTVQLLGSIVRLADGFDKPHKNLILRMEAKETPDEVNLYLKTIGFKPNLNMAEKKKDMLELTLQKKINFIFI